jgi:hypothetical protein
MRARLVAELRNRPGFSGRLSELSERCDPLRRKVSELKWIRGYEDRLRSDGTDRDVPSMPYWSEACYCTAFTGWLVVRFRFWYSSHFRAASSSWPVIMCA